MTEKEKTFTEIQQLLEKNNLTVKTIDASRPWGGFFVIEEADAIRFIEYFFPSLDKDVILSGKVSPKVLLVEPNKKLSWQYHHRRSEIWKLIKGVAAIVRSDTDEEKESTQLIINEVVQLQQGERHRLIGLSEWGVVAEIWMHTDPDNLSDENDIIRIQDDFGREIGT